MKLFGKREEGPAKDEGDATVKTEKPKRRRTDDYDVANAHPTARPDDVHKNLFSL